MTIIVEIELQTNPRFFLFLFLAGLLTTALSSGSELSIFLRLLALQRVYGPFLLLEVYFYSSYSLTSPSEILSSSEEPSALMRTGR